MRMLVGRKSFEGFAAYWPLATGPRADVLNPMPKYVASRSALDPLDCNAEDIEADAVEGVRKLKGGHADDLVMSGCGELAANASRPASLGSVRLTASPASTKTCGTLSSQTFLPFKKSAPSMCSLTSTRRAASTLTIVS
jgi:dihydrofolate reductase